MLCWWILPFVVVVLAYLFSASANREEIKLHKKKASTGLGHLKVGVGRVGAGWQTGCVGDCWGVVLSRFSSKFKISILACCLLLWSTLLRRETKLRVKWYDSLCFRFRISQSEKESLFHVCGWWLVGLGGWLVTHPGIGTCLPLVAGPLGPVPLPRSSGLCLYC